MCWKKAILRGLRDSCSALLTTADSDGGESTFPSCTACVFGHKSTLHFLCGNGKDGFTYLADIMTSHKSISHHVLEVLKLWPRSKKKRKFRKDSSSRTAHLSSLKSSRVKNAERFSCLSVSYFV